MTELAEPPGRRPAPVSRRTSCPPRCARPGWRTGSGSRSTTPSTAAPDHHAARPRRSWAPLRRLPGRAAGAGAGPGHGVHDGRQPRACPRMPERPDAAGLLPAALQQIAARHLLQSARVARENGLGREGDHGVPAARHRHRRAAVGQPRVLGRADGRARTSTRRWRGPSRSTRRCATSPTSRWATRYPDAYIDYFGPDYRPPEYIRREAEEARQAPLVHDLAADHDQRHLLVRPQRDGGLRRVRGRDRAATSGSRPRGSASTGRRSRTCGGR